MVLVAPGIAEPDTALLRDLLEIGPPVRREEEGNVELVLAPRSTQDGEGLSGRRPSAAVAVGLLEGLTDVLPLALGLHHRDGIEPREQHIIGPIALRRVRPHAPLGDGAVQAFLREGAPALGERLRVDLPAGGAELRVDEPARGRLVEVHVRAGESGLVNGGLEGLRGCGDGLRLERGQLRGVLRLDGLDGGFGRRLQRLHVPGALRFDVLRQALPQRALFCLLGGALLGGEALLGLFFHGGADGVQIDSALRQLRAQGFELRCERGVVACRVGRGDERPRIEVAIVAKGPLEPDPQLAGLLELVEGFAVIASAVVDGVVAAPPELVEQLARGEGQRAALREPTQHIDLGVSRVDVDTHLRGGPLRQDLPESPERPDARHRKLRKLPLRLGPQDDQPRIVVREEVEVTSWAGEHAPNETRAGRRREGARRRPPPWEPAQPARLGGMRRSKSLKLAVMALSLPTPAELL